MKAPVETGAPMPRFRATTELTAAPIAMVDPILGRLLIEVGGAHEWRHGRPWMFGHGCDPQAGDFLVEYDDGGRAVFPRTAFLAMFAPLCSSPTAAPPLAPATRPHG